MTQTLGVNASNDIYVGVNGNVVVLQGQSAVSAACRSTSLASLSEEVLSLNSGQPFFQAAFLGVTKLAIFENYLRASLAAVDGVIAVSNLSTKITKTITGKSVLSYTATIKNKYGLTAIITGESPPV